MSDKNFPAMRWHPETGEARVFNAAHEVPEGWGDKHPNDPAYVKPEKPGTAGGPEKPDLTREEITAALTAGGVEYAKNAKTETLYAKLTEAVKTALTARAIVFEPDAPTSALLKLIPAE